MGFITDEKMVEGNDDVTSYTQSLPVSNVQEMVTQDPLQPERYLSKFRRHAKE